MEKQSLSTQTIRGIFWTGTSVAANLLVTFLFFKHLPLEVMGQFQGALVVVLLLALVGDLGLGMALVRFREAEEGHFSTAFWTNLGLGLLIVVALVAGAPLVSSFAQDAPGFQAVLVPLAALIPFAAVSGVMRARLQRELRFRSIAVAEIVAVLWAGGVGVVALAAGLGPWAPILNAITREVALLAGLWWAAAWRPRFVFGMAYLRNLLRFGFNITGANGLNYLNANLDYLFIMYFLGDKAMGYYSFAYRFTMLPYARLAQTVNQVLFPALASVQEEDERLRQGYLKSATGIALLAWPLLAGALVFPAEILQWVNQELAPAGSAFRLLALTCMLKAIGTTVGSVFLAKDKSHWAFRWTLFSLLVLLPGFYFSVRFGTAGIAAGVFLFSLLFLVVSQHLVNRLIGLGFAAYLGALVRPGLVTAMVLAVVLLVKLGSGGLPLAVLLQAFLAGFAAYILALRLFAWGLCREYWHMLVGGGGSQIGAAPRMQQ